MTKIEAWIATILSELLVRRPDDFAGLGAVFYTARNVLPVHPLVESGRTPALPAKTADETVRLLASVTRRSSVCHDGFVLVDSETLWLTDVSQFLSPPIPDPPLSVANSGGARHMAARLASLLPEVPLSLVWSGTREFTVYERGAVRTVAIGS